jgi:integrase
VLIHIPLYTENRVTNRLQILSKAKLTAGRIERFHCPGDKEQAFLWCAETPGLGVRATANSERKRYVFQSKVKGQSMRITIGDVSAWSVAKAQAEARRLQVLIDQGSDPRRVKADKEAADEAEEAAVELEKITRTATVAEVWQEYVAERGAAVKDGKPEWGDRHRAHLAYFVQPGGIKRTRGRRPHEAEVTRPGALAGFMTMRLIELDAAAVQAWLDKEVPQAPTSTAKAFSVLRAFLAWCKKKEKYKAAVHPDACSSDDVKQRVPSPKTKKNDSLRRAQIAPWFDAVRRIGNPVISAYLQTLLLTGARRNELTTLRWKDVDFQWKSLTIRDKVEGERTIPLTPYVEHLISPLPRRNEFVFSSPTAASGRLEEPRIPHNRALGIAALPALSLHGLRRSFGTLSEWVEVPAGIVAQIMGHKPSAIAEKHYIQRELDLLHLWHVKIEAWILEQAGIEFVPEKPGLQVVKST